MVSNSTKDWIINQIANIANDVFDSYCTQHTTQPSPGNNPGELVKQKIIDDGFRTALIEKILEDVADTRTEIEKANRELAQTVQETKDIASRKHIPILFETDRHATNHQHTPAPAHTSQQPSQQPKPKITIKELQLAAEQLREHPREYPSPPKLYHVATFLEYLAQRPWLIRTLYALGQTSECDLVGGHLWNDDVSKCTRCGISAIQFANIKQTKEEFLGTTIANRKW